MRLYLPYCIISKINRLNKAEVIELLVDKNLYYVGGVVRDEILGINSVDTDFCYEGDE